MTFETVWKELLWSSNCVSTMHSPLYVFTLIVGNSHSYTLLLHSYSSDGLSSLFLLDDCHLFVIILIILNVNYGMVRLLFSINHRVVRASVKKWAYFLNATMSATRATNRESNKLVKAFVLERQTLQLYTCGQEAINNIGKVIEEKKNLIHSLSFRSINEQWTLVRGLNSTEINEDCSVVCFLIQLL